jgi:hypothetical protein
MITQERLKELFEYDPEEGRFYNRFSRGRAREACEAGSPAGHGYRKITIDYEKYYEHHLVWFYVYGEWPSEIDHKDGNRSNNKIANLRIATRTENCFNAKRETGMSGLKGAYKEARGPKWYSKIQIGGCVTRLGTFNTPEEAHRAFMAAVETRHGEFAFDRRSHTGKG